jgi:hypothetical protein
VAKNYWRFPPLCELCASSEAGGEFAFGQEYLFMKPKKIKKHEQGRKLKKTGDHFYPHIFPQKRIPV